ncbi:TPA: hypothetical protein DIC38_02835 [Candidatus Nomurabacteria bacterium]|nr:MAG: Segregation and condensation protein A [Parcubacteria bacterium RAAC4_OD1_1]HCY26589.1 hypothetical protein [Candidatus Nomurabacteria bacterium]
MEETVSQYRISQGVFEGPLDVLLGLIEARKLFINEISLAQVTNDYIEYIKSFKNRPESEKISDASYFILIAATLILIKSKSLLPNINLTEEENKKIIDLEKRLKIYQIVKNASIDIKNNFGIEIIFTPMSKTWDDPIFSPDKNITKDSMLSLVSKVINSIPKKEKESPEISIKKVINIEEIINSLTERIEKAINLSFKDFVKSRDSNNKEEIKVNVIVSFLAMLELVREGIIEVMQNGNFTDIEINSLKENNLESKNN